MLSVTNRLIELNPHLKKGVKSMDKNIADKMESARISAYKTRVECKSTI